MVTSVIGRIVILLLTVVLMVVGLVGMTQIRLGLDIQDFFPSGNAGGQFATHRAEYFPVWPVWIMWGPLDYESPAVQLRMASQYERLVDLKQMSAPVGASNMWTAHFAMWGQTTTNTSCRSTLAPNMLNLKNKSSGGMCENDGSGCPVFKNLHGVDYAGCFNQWRAQDAGANPGAGVIEDDSGLIVLPIAKSMADGGGVMFGTGLVDTDAYVKLIKDARAIVDNHPACTRPEDCLMSGTPFSYWEQYLDLIDVMFLLGGVATALAFIISIVFLFLELTLSGRGTPMQRLVSSGVGALLIAFWSAASMGTVVGFCGLADIQLSSFTAMSALISTGLAVEFSVHVVHRFIEAPSELSGADRVDYAMEWLFKPTMVAFLTSALGVGMMGLSEFEFVKMYFFAPLMIAVLATYFYGIFAMPALLCFLGCLPALEVIEKGEGVALDSSDANATGVAPVENAGAATI